MATVRMSVGHGMDEAAIGPTGWVSYTYPNNPRLGTSHSLCGKAAGGATVGRGFELCSTHDFPPGFFPILTGSLSRGATKVLRRVHRLRSLGWFR